MISDRLILAFDRALRTVCGPSHSARPIPGENLPESELDAAQRSEAAALMRINHVREVCAQALYQGQALTARNASARDALQRAAEEEVDHLAWTERRIAELGDRPSLLNPLWYAGSFAIGFTAGRAGDAISLGFVVETERQVEEHLAGHLDRLPAQDTASRAVVEKMREDEARHGRHARAAGAAELPPPVVQLMRLAARVMTTTAHRL